VNPGTEGSILFSNSNISGGMRSIEVKGKGECEGEGDRLVCTGRKEIHSHTMHTLRSN